MSKMVYVPIIKTSDAEIRAIENLSVETQKAITPLFELTRSRICKRQPEGDVFRRLNRVVEAYGRSSFIIDLTGDLNMTNQQIEQLRDSGKGYRNWVRFILSLKPSLSEVVPVIQISDEGVDSAEEFYNRIRSQVESLREHFDKIVYRFPLDYEFLNEDLAVITQAAPDESVICVVDAGFIPQDRSRVYAESGIKVLEAIDNFPCSDVVVCATSFPKNVTDIGGDDEGEIGLEECAFYKHIASHRRDAVVYGDYATVNPTRSLQAGGRGWIPRIDVPIESSIFYYRSRRTDAESNYARAYARVAERVSVNRKFTRLARSLDGCWGVEQIGAAAKGHPQGLSPSFWISVRMNIHMSLRTALLHP